MTRFLTLFAAAILAGPAVAAPDVQANAGRALVKRYAGPGLSGPTSTSSC